MKHWVKQSISSSNDGSNSELANLKGNRGNRGLHLPTTLLNTDDQLTKRKGAEREIVERAERGVHQQEQSFSKPALFPSSSSSPPLFSSSHHSSFADEPASYAQLLPPLNDAHTNATFIDTEATASLDAVPFCRLPCALMQFVE